MNINRNFLINFSFFILILSTFKISAQEKVSIAVLDLKGANITSNEILIISSRLRTDLFNTNKFIVVEREKMDEILKEQGFQLSGCTSNECAVEVGKLLGVRQIVAGIVGKIGKLYTISIRLIDVESGKLLKTATEDCECPIEIVVTQSLQNVAQILSGEDVQKSTYNTKSSSFSSANNIDDNTTVKEWELIGMSRNEYIKYKRSGLNTENWKNFKSEYNKNTPFKNSLFSLLIPGLGQFKLEQKRAFLYLGLDIFCIWSMNHNYSLKVKYDGVDRNKEQHHLDVAETYLLIIPIIHLISSVDAGFSSFKYRKGIEKKYNVTMSLDYDKFYKTPMLSLNLKL